MVEKTVYGDLLFFVNFCMDFQCLFLTAKLLRRPFHVWRGVIFSVLGALYACVALFLETNGVFAFFSDLAVCLFMCIGVFWQKRGSMRRVLVPFGVYFGVSFAVGGVMSGLGALLSHIELPLGSEGEIGTGAFFFLAFAGGLSTFLWGRFCQRRAKGKRAVLHLIFEGREIRVDGLVDTANFLCDPIGGRPVVILDEKSAKELFSPALFDVLRAGESGALEQLPDTLARRVKLIPSTSVAGSRLLLAVAPDRAYLDTGRGEVASELLVALSPETRFADCAALLPAALVTE